MHHSYSLLRVLDAARFGVNERLLQLRNPWGNGKGERSSSSSSSSSGGWSGAWCDSSPEWARAPQRLRDACAPYGAELGIFWMRLEDFALCFRRLDVAKVRGFDPMSGRLDPARLWSTLRAELPLPAPGAAEVFVLRVRVAADADVDLVASLSARQRRRVLAAAAPSGSGGGGGGGGGASSPVVWRRRNSESAAAADGAGGAAEAEAAQRDLALLVVEELPGAAAARRAAAAAADERARNSVEATGMRVLRFSERGEERRGVGLEVAMAECRLAGPSAGAGAGAGADVGDSDGFRTYYICALSLNCLGLGLGLSLGAGAAAAATALLEVHCSSAVLAECVARPLPWLARALVARTLVLEAPSEFRMTRGGAPVPEAEQREVDAAHAVVANLDGAGAVFCAVNRHPADAFVARTSVDAGPVVARRAAAPQGSGRAATSTEDSLPPLHAQLLQLATYQAARRSIAVSTGRTTGGRAAAEAHEPALTGAGAALFAPFPLFC